MRITRSVPQARTARMRAAAIATATRKDDGLTTAEYAVGTVAAAGLGGILIKLLTSPEVRDLIWSVLTNAFQSLVG